MLDARILKTRKFSVADAKLFLKIILYKRLQISFPSWHASLKQKI